MSDPKLTPEKAIKIYQVKEVTLMEGDQSYDSVDMSEGTKYEKRN